MGSRIAGYSVNDMYYVSATCKEAINSKVESVLKTSCENNEKATDNIIKNKNRVESEKEKYENMKDLYNREVLHFFNMSLGIAGLIYYVYKNQDALPNFFM
jgi:hypothetical protein